jgi:uncharacterized protein (TIGR02001 family)
MKKILLASAVTSAMLLPSLASADLSATVGLVSDYTFNGVSQTDSSPALQVGLDYGTDDFYVGSWASNVDYGDADDTVLELDFYGGKYFQISQALGLDAGLAYYTYHGDSDNDDGYVSMDSAYGEAYAKLGVASEFGQSEFNVWYAWDYAGSEAGHVVTMVAHSYDVAEGHTLRLSLDQSTSLDDEKFSWGPDGDASYTHYRLGYSTSVEGFDLSLAVENTSIDSDSSDARVVAGVSHTYAF